MEPSKASKGSSQSFKNPKASLPSRFKQKVTKKFEKSYRKESSAAQSESERDNDTPSSAAPTSSTRLQPAAHANALFSGREHSAADTTVPNREQPEASATKHTDVDRNKPSEMSLWDNACANMRARDENSKHLRLLEQNLSELSNRDTVANDIEQIVNTKQDRFHAKDGLTQSTGRKIESRSVRFVMSTRDLAMGLARLDPHGIAPIVLGGVYTIVRVLHNDTEESQVAMTAVLELAGVVALWTGVEKRQISNNSRPRLKVQYQKLSELIVKLYEGIIVLFGTMMAYYEQNRFRQILGAIAPADLEWKNMQAEIKSRETNCNNIKNLIALEKENQEQEMKILKWISSHDIRGSLQNVLERTGIEMKYSARCQWILNHTKFEEWSRQGNSSVLWLKGTIGTGKTTLMARAIQEIRNSAMTQIYGMPLAIFFFQKASDSSTGLLSVEICLRSLVRQLAWNSTDEEIEPLVEEKYNDLCNQHSDNSLLSTQECKKLLQNLISERETYIMIDAVDECEKPHELLWELAELISPVHNMQRKQQPFHLMLCGRDDLPISDYFDNCLMIATNSEDTSEDQKFYIDHEIDQICHRRKNSLFVLSSKDFPSRLKKVLKEKGGCLFRWIEIQLDIFRVKNFRTCNEIEDQLEWLGTHTKLDVLDREYARLFALLKEHPPFDQLSLGSLPNDELALKMLRLLACSEFELGAEDLAEAMTASNYINDDMALTPDDVRRILVGFISEAKPTRLIKRHPTGSRVSIVQLAHSSVFEYLTDDIKGFSASAKHSEAALLCFSRISESERQPELYPKAGLSFSFSETAAQEKTSYFLKYSYIAWPIHCRRAFDEDPRCLLLEQAKNFILSDGYMRWNKAICSPHLNREFPSLVQKLHLMVGRYPRSFRPSYFELGSMSCNDLLPRPGFVVARYSLTELLEFHEIRVLIDLQHTNSQGMTLLLYALTYSDRSTIDRLIELNPNEVRPSQGQNTLEAAIQRGFADVVKKLLDNGEDVNARTRRGTSALFSVTEAFSNPFWLHGSGRGSQAHLNTIPVLLQHGVHIFETNVDGLSLLHVAALSGEPELSRLFVEHAHRLEESGLIGTVQRLLRVRNFQGLTPLDCATSWHKTYLQDELNAAVLRNDGKIMYEFGTPHITEISHGYIDEELFMDYLKGFYTPPKQNTNQDSYEKAATEYRAWLNHRRKELDEQYEAYRQQITSGSIDHVRNS